MRGRALDIGVGDANNVWAIGADDRLPYVYAGDERVWRRPSDVVGRIDGDAAKTASAIAVGATAFEVWIVDNYGEAHR